MEKQILDMLENINENIKQVKEEVCDLKKEVDIVKKELKNSSRETRMRLMSFDDVEIKLLQINTNIIKLGQNLNKHRDAVEKNKRV